jgi:hypothetical protein
VAHVQRRLIFIRASRPCRPLPLVANSTLCQAEKLSSWRPALPGGVNGHFVAARLQLAAADTTSGQVEGSFVVSMPPP